MQVLHRDRAADPALPVCTYWPIAMATVRGTNMSVSRGPPRFVEEGSLRARSFQRLRNYITASPTRGRVDHTRTPCIEEGIELPLADQVKGRRGGPPVPASSGKVSRHRLNRGGDRAANSALHIIAIGRLRTDARTKAYVDKRIAQGHSKLEAIRCVKRYIAREVFTLIRQRGKEINQTIITS